MPLERLVLVRIGEITLKGKNRPAFERQLIDHLRQAVRPVGARVERLDDRIFVRGGNDPAEVPRRLGRVFGVVSLSPVLAAPLSLEAIQAAALQSLREALASLPARVTGAGGAVPFKVAVRRANKRFPLNTMELNRELGAYLLRQQPGLRVDVHQPEVTVRAEVRDDAAYVYTASLPGPGGLPAGMSGRAHLLLSGGIDSPVAGWMAMKRGLELEAVHFQSPPFTSERARDKVIELCRLLAEWGGRMALHLVHFTAIQQEIYQRCPADLGVTLMRRMMFRLAEGIARDRGGLALVTGESLGQVASQTLESLHVINQATALPVLRPLIALDKTEIVDRARAIGTFDTSVLPYEDCCTVFVPKHPRTRPRLEDVLAAEWSLDIPALLAAARERTEVVEI